MRKLIIAILLLTGFTAQSQTKWRQIERSLTKWNVPAAYDSIPGQTGYAGKWVALTTLLDTLGIDSLGNFTIIDSTIIYGGFGMQVTESPSNTFTLDIDSSKVATAYDLTLVDQSITNEIQIIDTFQVFDTNKLRISLSQDGQAAKFVTIPSPVDSTQILAGYGLIVNESPSNTWNISADSSKLATQYDLTDCLKGSGVTNRIALWSADTLTSNGNLTFTSGNLFNLIGRMIIKATSTSGDWNAFINGGNTTLTGNGNIAIGSNQTFVNATTADNNIVLGPVAGNQLTTGDNNIFLGANTGQQNTTSSNNTYVGHTSGVYNTGADNTYIGSGSGHTATNVSNNTYVGSNAGYNATNSNNVYMGFYSGFASTNSGTFNVVIGNEASKDGGGSYNVKLGALAGNGNTGSNNVFLGYDSGRTSSTKNGNIFIGYQSGRNEDIDNSLIIANSASTSNGIYGDFDNSKYGVNIAPASAARTWDINGELRIRDLTTDNATKLLGADNDGDVSGITIGSGLTVSGTTLSANFSIDSTIVTDGYGINVIESPANNFTVSADTAQIVTPYDLSLVDQSNTNEIQIIDTFQVFDTNKLRISLSQDGQAAKFVTIPSPVDSTQILAGYGLIVNESPSNTWNISADSSKLATQYDLTDCLKGSGVTNRIALWSADTLTSNGNLTFTSGNLFNLIGRMIIKATSTSGDWNAFFNGGNTTLTGNNNIAIGNNQTLQSITTGDNNISLGSVSGLNLTTGDDNVFVGASAGRGNTTGSSNTYIGTISGFTNNGDANTFIGIGAGAIASNVTTNTYVGAYAGYTASNSSNVYMGFYSGFGSSNSGSNNVAVGNESSNNGGGSNNVKIGATSGKTNTGSNNVFVGYDSGQASSSKGGNVFIGYQSGRNEDIDNSLIIANSSSTSNGIYGDFDNSKFGVNIAPSSAARTWDVNGELRVRDLTTDNPTKMLGADNDGDMSGVNVGVGLTLSGTTLTADTSKLATPYDLSLVDQSATNEIQTIDTFQIFDTNKLRISLSQDNQAAKVVTLPNGTGTNLTLTGSASPFTLNSDTGTDVTFKQGYGILLTRNSNELTIESLFEVPETWQSYTTYIHNWDATGLFGSGKDVGIGGQPSRDFDVIGLSRFRGAVYDSTNTSGTTGQVITSKGSNAWRWETPATSMFAQLYRTSNITSDSLTATERIINFTNLDTFNVSANTSTDEITINNNGVYKITYSGSFSISGASKVVSLRFNTYKNGSDLGYIGEMRTRNSENDINNMNDFSRSFVVDLNAGDDLSLYFKKSTGTDTTISFFNINLIVQRIK